MVKKLRKMAEKKAERPAGPQGSQLAATVKESAQQIWLAGLGAFAKAQEEGTKVFEALVKEGATIQTKSQAEAEGRPGPSGGGMSSMVGEIAGRAGHWDKLEAIFEDRVAKALNRLGVPSNRDLDALAARIEGLDKTVSRLAKGSAASQASSKAPAEAAPKAKAKSTTAATKATPKASSKSAAKPAGRRSNGSAEPAAKRVARKSAA